VLQTGEEIREITDKVEFLTDVPTIAVGNMFGAKRIVQIYPQGVRLLQGGLCISSFGCVD
jgi:cleavage and polyadenylation specificity factor subunit 1